MEGETSQGSPSSEPPKNHLKDVSKDAAWRNLCSPSAKTPLLNFDLDQAKARLRHTIEVSLQPNLALPEVADILTEFLLDVVQEDPQQGILFRSNE